MLSMNLGLKSLEKLIKGQKRPKMGSQFSYTIAIFQCPEHTFIYNRLDLSSWTFKLNVP